MEETKLSTDVWAVHYLGRIENTFPLCGLVPEPDRELFFTNDLLSVTCVDCKAEIKNILLLLKCCMDHESGGVSARHRR